MPTFTAAALDGLLEPAGARKSMTSTMSVPDPRLGRRNSNPVRIERGGSTSSTMVDRAGSVPPRLEKGTSLSISNMKTMMERNDHWTQISPALYATPESTPVPYSPSSFPSSPYVINHKRRGPGLVKSYSKDDVATSQRDKEDNGSFDSVNASLSPDNQVNGTSTIANQVNVHGQLNEHSQACEIIHDSADQTNTGKIASFSFQVGEVDEFLDPQYSSSMRSSTEIDVIGLSEKSTNVATAVAEFYDAWEELSSDNGPQQQLVPDIESELREIRLSLLMEIEKRKQAEEAFNTMCTRWQIFRSHLSSVGLALPADPLAVSENEELENSAEVLCQQLYLGRFVSNSVGRGIAKAEVEMEMEAQLELKNFEIARLADRLRYYEAVNREMSQRNQATIDNTRQLRQRRKRRQRWIWGSVAATITIGSAFLAWSYVSTGKGTPSTSHSHASES